MIFFLCNNLIHFKSLLCTLSFEMLRLSTLSVHSAFLIDQLSKCEFQSACWHSAHSLQKRKKTPVRENRSEEKTKWYYRSWWDPFLHVFLKKIFEPVCQQTNQLKDGERDKAFSDFCPFLKSDRAEEVKITVTNKVLRKESRICVLVWGFFLLDCFFHFLTTCQLSNTVTWGLGHYDLILSGAL